MPNTSAASTKFKDLGDAKPTEYWEIKMGWSEYRNGKWTQKQQSTYTIVDNTVPAWFFPFCNLYDFVPRVVTGGDGARLRL